MTQMGEQRCHQTARYLQDSPFSKEGVPRTQGPATSILPHPNHPRVWCLLQGSEVGGKGSQEKEPNVSSGVPRGLTEAIIPSGQGRQTTHP